MPISKIWDRVVIGAGSAGQVASTAAIHAAKASVERSIQTIAPVDFQEALETENDTVMMGEARSTSGRTLSVDGLEVRFRQAVVATGGSPIRPSFTGSESIRIRTSEDFCDLTDLPGRLAVLGGGSIGCELGQAMARLGADVTIVHRGARILPKEEEDASRIGHDALWNAAVADLRYRTRQGATAVAIRNMRRMRSRLLGER